MSRLKWFAALALVVIAAGSAYWSRTLLTARATPAPVRAVSAPEWRSIAATVTTTGMIRLRVGSEVRVGSQVSGIVRKLNVTVGSHIQHGDVIAEIDARPIEARLGQAQAQAAVSAQQVRKTEVELARAKTLYDKGLVPRQQFEDATLAADAANADLEKTRRDVAAVETDLSYTVIQAPITGTVASVTTQEGETVAASFTSPTFVTIIADHALELIAMVDETDIGSVSPRNAVTFSVEAYPSDEFEGHVERVAPKATIVSGVVNYEVEVGVDSPSNLLKPDMTANISIRTAERRALVVPTLAIVRDGDERFVYIDESGKSVKRVVTTGVRQGNVTEIKKGLAPSDRVVTAPVSSGVGKD